MAKRSRTSAYSASDLHKAVEASRANVTITDSLSSDEEAPPATSKTVASEKTTPAKRGRRARAGRSSKAAQSGTLMQVEEVTSYVRSTAPDQAEAVTMDDLLPLLNGASGNSSMSDQLDEDNGPETDKVDAAATTASVVAPAPAVAATTGAKPAESSSKGKQARSETATPTLMQGSPTKRKRGRPSKADIAERERLAEISTAQATEDAATAASAKESAGPATSSKKRKRISKVRRESSPPAVEVRDSLFATQEDVDSVAPSEQAEPLFRSLSVESESPPPPASNPRPSATKGKTPREDAEAVSSKKSSKKAKVTAKDKGKARAISPEPVAESDSSSEEAEEEVQKSLVQDLPKRRSAKKQKVQSKEHATAAEASGSGHRTRASTAAKGKTISTSKAPAVKATTSTPAKPVSKASKKVVPAATPVASGSGTNANTQNGDDALMPTPSASRPKWIQTRIRKLTIQQHKNFLAHRTRTADRVRGNAWTEDEEITLILALNDMYNEGGVLGNQEDITKNQYKRWRYIQEQHGVDGSLSDVLAQRSNVDIKDKARNIQKYREALGLPVFNWYTYPHEETNSSQ